jgi:hypothetical protein|tara:strand:- start:462 stop:599 length:138 start_codon:yes stop_codon:yes gene_type:complete
MNRIINKDIMALAFYLQDNYPFKIHDIINIINISEGDRKWIKNLK